MKNIQLLSILFLCLFLTNCTEDFDSINDNPNAPQEVSPEFLLTNVIAAETNENTYNQGLRLNNYLAQFTQNKLSGLIKIRPKGIGCLHFKQIPNSSLPN